MSKALALPGSSPLEPGAFRDTCPEPIASDLSGGPDNATSSVLGIQMCCRGRRALSLLKTELLQRFGGAGAWFMCRVGSPLAGNGRWISLWVCLHGVVRVTTEYAKSKEEGLEGREELLGGSEGTLEMRGTGQVVQPLCCGHNKLSA